MASIEPFPDGPFGRLAPPPVGRGVILVEGRARARICLPRRLTSGDVAGTALAGAVAVWIGAGAVVAAGDGGIPAAGLLLLALIGLAFAVGAAVMLRAIATGRVIEERGDALYLSRTFRGRQLDERTIPKSAIQAVDRAGSDGAGPVRIRTPQATYRIGGRLEPEELEWLYGAVRTMAARRSR
ncbi:MAG: hypothetical protein R6U63_04805 [Longimicrobiales bacterium]